MTVICAYCLKLISKGLTPSKNVSHGICMECYDKFNKDNKEKNELATDSINRAGNSPSTDIRPRSSV